MEECAIDPSYSLKNGDTPFTVACANNQLRIVNYFLGKSSMNLAHLLDQIPHKIIDKVKGAVESGSFFPVGLVTKYCLKKFYDLLDTCSLPQEDCENLIVRLCQKGDLYLIKYFLNVSKNNLDFQKILKRLTAAKLRSSKFLPILEYLVSQSYVQVEFV